MNGKQVKRINKVVPKMISIYESQNIKEPEHKYVQSKQNKMIRLAPHSVRWIKQLLKKQFKRMNHLDKFNLFNSQYRIVYGV